MTGPISIGQASLNGRPHALYRFYDRSDVLLYVGITVDPGARFKKHGGDKEWWTEVDRINIEHYATRREALDAEKKAIKEEQPLHNKVHNVMVAAGSEEENIPLACDIVYGMIGIDHQGEEHHRLIKLARASAAEDERPFGDPDEEVARLLVSDLMEEQQEKDHLLYMLFSAIPKAELETHRAFSKKTWEDHGVESPSDNDVIRVVVHRLAGELAWQYLGRIPHEQRRYFLELAMTHNLEDYLVPIEAMKYYQHYLDGDLQQVLESEGR